MDADQETIAVQDANQETMDANQETGVVQDANQETVPLDGDVTSGESVTPNTVQRQSNITERVRIQFGTVDIEESGGFLGDEAPQKGYPQEFQDKGKGIMGSSENRATKEGVENVKGDSASSVSFQDGVEGKKDHSLGNREVGSSRNQENLGHVGFPSVNAENGRVRVRMGNPGSPQFRARVEMGMRYPRNPGLNTSGVNTGTEFPGNSEQSVTVKMGTGNPGFNIGTGSPRSPWLNAGFNMGMGYPRYLEVNSDVNTGMGYAGTSEVNHQNENFMQECDGKKAKKPSEEGEGRLNFLKNFPTMPPLDRDMMAVISNLPILLKFFPNTSPADRAKMEAKMEELDSFWTQHNEMLLEFNKLLEMLQSTPEVLDKPGDVSLIMLVALYILAMEFAERAVFVLNQLLDHVRAENAKSQE